MGGREASRTIQTLQRCRTTPLLVISESRVSSVALIRQRIGGDHPVVHFRHRTTCVEIERVRWVEWQQDKLLALGRR